MEGEERIEAIFDILINLDAVEDQADFLGRYAHRGERLDRGDGVFDLLGLFDGRNHEKINIFMRTVELLHQLHEILNIGGTNVNDSRITHHQLLSQFSELLTTNIIPITFISVNRLN